MTEFFQYVVAGTALGARYALVALGFVVIYKATGVINFAQGSFVALGAYFTYNAHVTWGLPFAAAVLVAMVGSALVGIAIYWVVLRRVLGQPAFAIIMITVGLLYVIDQVITTVWGPDALNLEDPWGIDTVSAGGVVISMIDIWTVLLTAAVLIGFYVLFRHSSMGLAMRAAAHDPEAAMARGISVRRVVAVSWAIAAAVAALAGITVASGPAQLTPSLSLIALAAFPAMILGGLDSPLGAVLGGFIIGISQSLTRGYMQQFDSALATRFYTVMPYVVMIAILMVRPYGLFGTKEATRL
ncbi:MAG TPA: branched-chain amino acid ABC transporter permease [Acidimicrobiales bacterium]